MPRTTTMTVCLGGTLREFIAANMGEGGSYENVSGYIRDLIWRDKDRMDREVFDRLKAELTQAFAAPDTSYQPLTAAEVIARTRSTMRPLHIFAFHQREAPSHRTFVSTAGSIH